MSHVTVFNWIKAYGKKLDEIRSSDVIEVIEIDEMHIYWFKKNYCWRWIAVDRAGRKFIYCGVGTRGTGTGEKLWKKIEPKIKGEGLYGLLESIRSICARVYIYNPKRKRLWLKDRIVFFVIF